MKTRTYYVMVGPVCVGTVEEPVTATTATATDERSGEAR